MKKIKAIGLFSGGLDSLAAIKLIEEQRVEVLAVNFLTSFFSDPERLKKVARDNHIKLKIIDISEEYLEKVVKRPKHGYGKNMNPCIDCKIFLMKQARKIMKKEKAQFIFTGEVLGQRPMSQKNTPLKIIKKESGLKDKLVRPLSAKLLPKSEAEDKGWIRREKLLDIEGRNRKKQYALAEKYSLSGYGAPAGGCLLAEKAYSAKLRDLFENEKNFSLKDVALLKAGRNFRLGRSRIIVGRDQEDNKKLEKLKGIFDILFKVKDDNGPITLLRGEKSKPALAAAASLTVRYSDAPGNEAVVAYGRAFKKSIKVPKMKEKGIEELRIA
ncbi:DUF814 domain-containing protein [Candidatus Falkowbacteria bacterium]|nr:DUF814 domain-containing protein [Candidatus Falkowbacteria bacterium]